MLPVVAVCGRHEELIAAVHDERHAAIQVLRCCLSSAAKANVLTRNDDEQRQRFHLDPRSSRSDSHGRNCRIGHGAELSSAPSSGARFSKPAQQAFQLRGAFNGVPTKPRQLPSHCLLLVCINKSELVSQYELLRFDCINALLERIVH